MDCFSDATVKQLSKKLFDTKLTLCDSVEKNIYEDPFLFSLVKDFSAFADKQYLGCDMGRGTSTTDQIWKKQVFDTLYFF